MVSENPSRKQILLLIAALVAGLTQGYRAFVNEGGLFAVASTIAFFIVSLVTLWQLRNSRARSEHG